VTGKLCFAFPNKYNTTTAMDRRGVKVYNWKINVQLRNIIWEGGKR
jgi:hypothetical protein